VALVVWVDAGSAVRRAERMAPAWVDRDDLAVWCDVAELLVITGAAGNIGSMLRPRLARPGRWLRLLDVRPIPPAQPGERIERVEASVTDLDALETAFSGADAVVHLGGFSEERAWEELVEVNINGTYRVFEAARRQGVGR
jgi:uronate dehydrogenase